MVCYLFRAENRSVNQFSVIGHQGHSVERQIIIAILGKCGENKKTENKEINKGVKM